MNIRLYEQKDLERVNYLLLEAFNKKKSNFSNKEFSEIVCEIDNLIVGYLLITRILDPIKEKYKFHVDYVCVDANYRNRKIGYHMMNYVYDMAKKEGVMYIELTSSRTRLAAHKLYEKCGYIKRDSDIFRKNIDNNI